MALVDVKALVLIFQSRNDSRTTTRQMEIYETCLKELGKDIEVIWYEAGHLEGNLNEMIPSMRKNLHSSSMWLTAKPLNGR